MKDSEESGRGLFQDLISAFEWKEHTTKNLRRYNLRTSVKHNDVLSQSRHVKYSYLSLYSCCSHYDHKASVYASFYFSFLILDGR
jgi:hypothetical protein